MLLVSRVWYFTSAILNQKGVENVWEHSFTCQKQITPQYFVPVMANYEPKISDSYLLHLFKASALGFPSFLTSSGWMCSVEVCVSPADVLPLCAAPALSVAFSLLVGLLVPTNYNVGTINQSNIK